MAEIDKPLPNVNQSRNPEEEIIEVESKKEAEVMLSFGFINELLDNLADEPVQKLLRPLLATLFAQERTDLLRHIL